MTHLVLIDNKDSFTYNIVQYLRAAHAEVTVIPAADALNQLGLCAAADGLVISPGPGAPAAATAARAVFDQFKGRKPILGVCLGHQIIAEAYGATVAPAPRIMHGKSCEITTDEQGCFAGLPSRFSVVRYHSLSIDPASLPDTLSISCTAYTPEGALEIMGVRSEKDRVEGVQFHPEAILTEHGQAYLAAFVRKCRT